MHTKPTQLKANTSPLLQNYLHTVKPETYSYMPEWSLCLTHTQDINL